MSYLLFQIGAHQQTLLKLLEWIREESVDEDETLAALLDRTKQNSQTSELITY